MKKLGFSVISVLMVCAMIWTSLTFSSAAQKAEPLFRETKSEIVCSGGAKELILYDEDGNVIKTSAILPPEEVGRDAAAGAAQSYDSRTYGRITSVKRQGSAETCWAFATIGAVEAAYVTKVNASASSVDFSEDHAVWFTYAADPGLGDGPESLGSNTAPDGAYLAGGYWNSAAFTLINWSGAEQESRAPYDPANMNNNGHLDESMRKDSFAHVQGAQRLAQNHDDVIRNAAEIKNAIMSNGACMIYYSYASDNQNGSAYYHERIIGGQEGGHFVTVVGWDDNYPKSNFKSGTGAVPSKNGAWLIKNSAGVSHGDQGYDWLSYEDVSTREAVVFDVEPVSNYDHMYGYNGFRANQSDPQSMTKLTYANAFVSPAREELKAVGLWTAQDNINYTIDIYRNLSESAEDPTSGQLVSSCRTSGNARREGYRTVPLNASVTLNAGERYAVVVTIEALSHNYLLLPFENMGYSEPLLHKDHSLSIAYSSEVGESFIYYEEDDDGEWLDAHIYDLNNALINVYTKDAAPVTGFTYSVSDGEATITGYTGSAETVEIPSAIDGYTVKAIGAKAFLGNTKIRTVYVPYTVTSIDNNAFSYCTNLTNVLLPSSLKTIGGGVFYGCTSLESIDLPAAVTNIGRQCFDGCTALKSVTFHRGNSTLHVESFAFLNCPALKEVTIETSNIDIGAKAFGFTYNEGSYGSTGLTICCKFDSSAYYYYLNNSDTVSWKELKEHKLSSIAITKKPDKLEYYVGQYLDDLDPLEVTAYYADDTKKDITNKSIEVSGMGLLTEEGQHEIKVTYEERGISQSASFYVTVKKLLCSITAPSVVAVGKNETRTVKLQLSIPEEAKGLVDFYVEPRDESILEVDWDSTVFHDDDMTVDLCVKWLKAGATTMTVSVFMCDTEYVLAEAEIAAVTTRRLASVAVTKQPAKTTYNVGESLDKTGMVVQATFSDGSTANVTDYTCSTEAFTVPGVQNITVTYKENGETAKTTFPVTVCVPSAISIRKYVAMRTVDYRTTLTLKAEVTNPVDGAQIHWYIDGRDSNSTGDSYTLSQITTNCMVQAKYQKGSDVLAESKVECIKVNNGFFARLIAFFRSLFGRLPTITQAYLGFQEHE